MRRRFSALSIGLLLSGLLLLSLAGCASNPTLSGISSAFSPMLLIVWLFLVSAVGVLTGCGNGESGPSFPPNTFTGGTTTTTGTTGTTGTSTTGTQQVATALKFNVEPPTQGQVATPLSTFSVEVVDQNGSAFTSGSFVVTLTLAPGSSHGTLGGTLTATTVNGVATFNNVTISMVGTYTLTASANGLTSANSTPIGIGVLPLNFTSRFDQLTNNEPSFNASTAAVGDVNGDGVPDLVEAGKNNNGFDIEVLLGNSTAGPIRTSVHSRAATKNAIPNLTASFPITSLALGHFHGDTSPLDVVLTYASNSHVWLAAGHGDGTFGTPVALAGTTSVHTRFGLATGVFKAGDALDIAVAHGGVKAVYGIETYTVNQSATPSLSPISSDSFSGAASDIAAVAVGHFHATNGSLPNNQDLAVTWSNSSSSGELTLVTISASGKMSNSNITLADLPQDGSLAVGNIDGDALGLEGVAVAEYYSKARAYYSNDVEVFTASSKGTPSRVSTATAPLGVTNVALGDLNGDGKADLIVAMDALYASGSLSISQFVTLTANVGTALNNGSGSFPTFNTVPAAAQPRFLATGQFGSKTGVLVLSGDYSTRFDGQASLLVSKGDGTLVGPPPPLTLTGGPDSVEIADLNGKPEILGKVFLPSSKGGDKVFAMLGNGDGTFGNPVYTPLGSTPKFARGFAVGDVNGDHIPDIVLGSASKGSHTVFVMLGNADGTFKVTTVSNGVGIKPETVRLADVNGDGKLDIVTGDFGSPGGTVSVLLGSGDGTFSAVPGSPFATNLIAVTDVAVGNFAGDKNAAGAVVPDVVATVSDSYSSKNFAFLPNTSGTGSLGTAQTQFVSNTFSLRHVIAGDFDGDGKTDLVIENEVYNTQGYAIFLKGNGDGSFDEPTASSAGTPTRGTLTMKATDINGDGVVDLELAQYFGNDAMVLVGAGNGSFAPGVGFGTGAGASDVAVGDLNSDGKPDLVTVNYLDQKLTILFHQ
jgi:hypothetical protein